MLVHKLMNKDTPMLNMVSKLDKFRAIFSCAECSTEYTANMYDARKSKIGHLCKDCKSMAGKPITQELLKKHFDYDALTGLITCRLPQALLNVGDTVGSVGNHGYLQISIAGKVYLAHRLIWLYMTGTLPDKVDHINHNRLDNSWDNLREVCNTQNAKNCSVSKNSVTKINGVSFMKSRKKYRAYITVDRKQISLGLFTNIEDAIAARAQADKDYGFHTNHGN